ncbi:Bax inhibitor-1 family protein [Escherichia coli]|uniref:Bax inhibitor-1 family protein n=1 Tax=Escherichia coli TaxID=562 RepID=UPI002DB5AF14|nr:Bax inhibitor-1 family protein [Escherichia coli]MEC4284685.1 Bax inhibitor-1 family protein [Escherichia coli]
MNRRSSATQLQQKSALLSKMLPLIWWLTAAGVWATAGTAWILQHMHWVASLESPGAFVFALSALIIIGFWLNNALKRLKALGACLVYLLLILLIGFLFASLFTFSSIATVMGITGGMFATMALICCCINRAIPPVRQLCLYIFCGLSIAFVVNLILTSSFSVWLASILTVVIWGVTAACEATTLEDLIRVADFSDITGFLRCTVPGAITLYFSILTVLFRIAVTLLDFINGLVW